MPKSEHTRVHPTYAKAACRGRITGRAHFVGSAFVPTHPNPPNGEHVDTPKRTAKGPAGPCPGAAAALRPWADAQPSAARGRQAVLAPL